MKHILLIAASAVALGACAQTNAASWSRIDGSRATALELEQAHRICEPKSDTAAMSSNMGVIGIVMSKSSSMEACMAERGFKQAR